MDESSNAASNVARAIAAALDWNTSLESRKAAVSYLESVKAGDVRFLVSTSFLLVRKDWSPEIRMHGFKMLQHMVRLRWDEFNSVEQNNFANASIDLISEMANPSEEWALKSQTAALVAEVVRRGVNLWHELLPSLVPLSNKGPIEAEMVAMMLRWLPEDITVHNEDLEGERRRLLLRGLTQSLPEILPLLYTLLEKHFGAALSEAQLQRMDIAKLHAATVIATLNAVNAYAEWVPVPDLSKYGLIHGCGILLGSAEFRLHACEFFKLVSPRKRPVDDSASEFDSAMNNIFQIMMNVSKDILDKSSSHVSGIDESEFEFAECICECMVLLGTTNLQCIAGNDTMLSFYVQQMLGYFQHFKLALHFQSLPFWLALKREAVPKPKLTVQAADENSAVHNPGTGSGKSEKEKTAVQSILNDDICGAILDVSFLRLLKKNVQSGSIALCGTLELWSDEFDGKGEFSQYRSRLLELIRLVAFHKPLVAASRVSQRIEAINESYLATSLPQDLAQMESMHLALETTANAIFDGPFDFGSISSEIQFLLHNLFEGLLQKLLSLNWSEPAIAELHSRYLVSFGPFLKYFPDALGAVINKLFELLKSLPCALKDPSATGARLARLQICSSFTRIAKAADRSLLPHMKVIADTMACLQREGRLLRGEHNILGEAFLIMASAAGIQHQQEVLAWLLEPLSKQWTQVEWQNAYLSDPQGLVRLLSETSFMWSLFHTVTFFERALKRSGTKKGNFHFQSCSTDTQNSLPHPMASHLSWMLPPLLRLLRAVHSLWSLPNFHALPKELKVAMSMSHVEQGSLLGEGSTKLAKGAPTFKDGSQIDANKEGCSDANENGVHNWLKGIRDSGYNVLGLSTTTGENFFRCLDGSDVALALLENIQSMEFRHIRQLIHSVIVPLVKHCPADSWEKWLENLLPLFIHCQQTLSFSWSGLLNEGRAKVPDMCISSGLDLKVEVLEEKLLRDLTREICYLLSVMASPGLNSGLPSLEQLRVSRSEMASQKPLDAFCTNSLIGFLLMHKSLALPALKICIEAFTWTDAESVNKISSFSIVVILLAILTNNSELQAFVAKDLFLAIIQGLALESNAIISAELVALCKEIFVYLCDRDPSPRQILLSLPCISSSHLQAFEDTLAKISSPREQKQHMRSLLLSATGNKLKALSAQKTTNVITNVSIRTRSASSNNVEGDDVVGLATIT